MPQQMTLELLSKAEAARDNGMRASTAHADAKTPTWSDRALAFVHQYAVTHSQFTIEDVRIWAHNECGLPVAPDSRAWGSIPRSAAHRKWIVKMGKTTAKDPKVHCNEVQVWKSLIYAGS